MVRRGGRRRRGSRCRPIFYPGQRAFQVVAHFIDPEAQDVPAEVAQAARADLVAAAEFAVPMAMVVFAVDLDIEFALAIKEREIERVGRFFILRDGPQAGGVHGFVEEALPIGDQFGMGDDRILGSEFARTPELRVSCVGQTSRVFRKTREITDAEWSAACRSPTTTNSERARVMATLKRLPLPFRNRMALSPMPCRHHRGKENHIAFVALKAVNGIDHELQRGESLGQIAILMHQRADAVGLRAERRDDADGAVVSFFEDQTAHCRPAPLPLPAS